MFKSFFFTLTNAMETENRKLAFVQFEFALRQFYALRRINNEEDKTHTKLKTEVKTHPKIKCIYAVIVFSNGKFIRHIIKSFLI